MRGRIRAFALLLALAVTSLGILGGCSGARDFEAQPMTAVAYGSLDPTEIAQELVKSAATESKMVNLDASSIPSYYSFDNALVEEAVVYMSADSSCADEVAVFQMVEGADESPVIMAIDSRMQSKERAFRSISPTEYEKLLDAVQVSVSGYVVLAITSYPDTARSVIAEMLYQPIAPASDAES